MSPWLWFLVAVSAAVVGALLIVADHARRTAHQRERRRWAALRGWRFVLSDPVLADRWRYGVIARGGAGMATNLVVGSLFTPLGRRPVRIFDHEQGGKVTSVVVAVKRRFHGAELVAELWLPDRPLPQDPSLELLGPVGARYAFATAPHRARQLFSAELRLSCDGLGNDVPVLWLEQDWVLAAVPADASPSRFETLLRVLDEIADHVDAATERATATSHETAESDQSGQPGPPGQSGQSGQSGQPDQVVEVVEVMESTEHANSGRGSTAGRGSGSGS